MSYNEKWREHQDADEEMARDIKDLKHEQFKSLVQIVGILISLLIGGGAWWMNNLFHMVETQNTLFNRFQIETTQNYVPRSELQQIFSEINRKLDALQRDSTYGRERSVKQDRSTQ